MRSEINMKVGNIHIENICILGTEHGLKHIYMKDTEGTMTNLCTNEST